MKPVDMTPEIKVVDGKTVYFYSIAQMDYIRDKERESKIYKGNHPLATNPASHGHMTKHHYTHAV